MKGLFWLFFLWGFERFMGCKVTSNRTCAERIKNGGSVLEDSLHSPTTDGSGLNAVATLVARDD